MTFASLGLIEPLLRTLDSLDYKTPTANYTLEQAVAQGNLVPYRIVAHTTKFLRDGIKDKAVRAGPGFAGRFGDTQLEFFRQTNRGG